MDKDAKRATKIVEAAENAVAKIADPTARTQANAILAATRKTLAAAQGPAKRSPQRDEKRRGRDFDFDR